MDVTIINATSKIYTSVTGFSSQNVTDPTATDEMRERLIIAAVWQVVAPIWLFFGTLGNSLSCVVLIRPNIRRMSITPYLLALAVADLLALYSGLVDQWLKHQFGIYVSKLSNIGCKFSLYSIYVGGTTCTWILAMVSIERFMCVWFPIGSRLVKQRHRYVALVIMTVLALVFNSHILYGFQLSAQLNPTTSDVEDMCMFLNTEYKQFYLYTWSVTFMVATGIGPFVIILLCSIAIIAKLFLTHYNSQVRVHPSIGASRPNRKHMAETSFSERVGTIVRRDTDITRIRLRNRPIETRSTTIVLMAVNTMFLITTGPFQIFNVGYPYWLKGASVEKLAKLELIYTILFALAFINNISNFVLYCLSGPRFRKEFFAIMGFTRYEIEETVIHTDSQSNAPHM